MFTTCEHIRRNRNPLKNNFNWPGPVVNLWVFSPQQVALFHQVGLLAECPMTRGSLPNLRSDLVTGDNSGDSTESLIDEAEDYLRRSIDSMLTISSSGVSTDYWNRQTARRRRTRRYSEPDLIRDWHPPQDARPYLPKVNSIIYYLLRVSSVDSYCLCLNNLRIYFL